MTTTYDLTTLTPHQAARYLGVSESALRLWRSTGDGPRYFKAGEKLVRYRRVDLDAWIEQRLSQHALNKIRDVMARTHVAAVTVAVLLLWSVDASFRAVWPLLSGVLEYVFTAVVILDIPYFSWTVGHRMDVVWICIYSFSAVAEFCAAWLVSRWVFGVGPLRCLREYRVRFYGR